MSGPLWDHNNWNNLERRTHGMGRHSCYLCFTAKEAGTAGNGRKGECSINHAGLISLLCPSLHWLADTQRWRSAHSLWRLRPLIERRTAYNYHWAHGWNCGSTGVVDGGYFKKSESIVSQFASVFCWTSLFCLLVAGVSLQGQRFVCTSHPSFGVVAVPHLVCWCNQRPASEDWINTH